MLKKTPTALAWFLILSLALYFIYTNALRYFDLSSPVYTEDKKIFAFAFITHIAGGILALLLGPLQFISRIRRTIPQVHRSLGKVYLIAILISGLVSLYLAIEHTILKIGLVASGAGLVGLALAWLSTSAMAFVAVKRKNFVQHQEWMVRSYVVTCGFVTFRILFELLTKKFGVEFEEAASISAWSCWAVPLLITEIVLQAKKLTYPKAKAIIGQQEKMSVIKAETL